MIKRTGLHDLFLGEDVGLVFTAKFGKEGILQGSETFAVGTRCFRDFQSQLFLFNKMQKKDSLDSLLSFLMVDLTNLLCNPKA